MAVFVVHFVCAIIHLKNSVMNRNHFSYQASSEKMRSQFLTPRDSLGIVHTDSLWDNNRKQIVYIIKTGQMVTREIEVSLKGNMMILEAPLVASYDKPFRTHKVGKELRNEVEEGLTVIGFSEFKLKPGYHYTVMSSQVINPNLIKVILGFRPTGLNRIN